MVDKGNSYCFVCVCVCFFNRINFNKIRCIVAYWYFFRWDFYVTIMTTGISQSVNYFHIRLQNYIQIRTFAHQLFDYFLFGGIDENKMNSIYLTWSVFLFHFVLFQCHMSVNTLLLVSNRLSQSVSVVRWFFFLRCELCQAFENTINFI